MNHQEKHCHTGQFLEGFFVQISTVMSEVYVSQCRWILDGAVKAEVTDVTAQSQLSGTSELWCVSGTRRFILSFI